MELCSVNPGTQYQVSQSRDPKSGLDPSHAMEQLSLEGRQAWKLALIALAFHVGLCGGYPT